jgi:hypothetical protein
VKVINCRHRPHAVAATAAEPLDARHRPDCLAFLLEGGLGALEL